MMQLLVKILGLVLILIAIMYVFWPIDLVPDILPIVGWIDDVLAVLFLGITGIKLII